MRADPPHPEARRELALLHAERGEYRKAAELFEEELRATRKPDPTVYANLGLARAKAGEFERAEAALLQTLQHDEHHTSALANLAVLRNLKPPPLSNR